MESFRNKLINEFGIPSYKLPNSVLAKCLEDPNFLSDLLICWEDEFMYELLLKQIRAPHIGSNSDLIKSSTIALFNWLSSGMKFASKEVYEDRLNSCKNCKHLTIASGSVMYKLTNTTEVCGLCGCDVKKKARLLSESCPDIGGGSNGKW